MYFKSITIPNDIISFINIFIFPDAETTSRWLSG